MAGHSPRRSHRDPGLLYSPRVQLRWLPVGALRSCTRWDNIPSWGCADGMIESTSWATQFLSRFTAVSTLTGLLLLHPKICCSSTLYLLHCPEILPNMESSGKN